ncbi:MAG: hypothetical protein VYE68_17260 [Acidobacteriota bacterium]|nr:hypothetical protein [Acidobacteriota bacterium]
MLCQPDAVPTLVVGIEAASSKNMPQRPVLSSGNLYVQAANGLVKVDAVTRAVVSRAAATNDNLMTAGILVPGPHGAGWR